MTQPLHDDAALYFDDEDPFPPGGLLPEIPRPKTRGDCASVPRPCPFISCRYNLFLNVSKGGLIRLTHPTREPGDVDPRLSCALDVADRGPAQLEQISVALGIGRERVRQVELVAAHNLSRSSDLETLLELDEEDN